MKFPTPAIALFLCATNIHAFTGIPKGNQKSFVTTKIASEASSNNESVSIESFVASAALACSLMFGAVDPAFADGEYLLRCTFSHDRSIVTIDSHTIFKKYFLRILRKAKQRISNSHLLISPIRTGVHSVALRWAKLMQLEISYMI